MGPITLFLLVLIAALVAGHMLIYFTLGKKTQAAKSSENYFSNYFQPEDNGVVFSKDSSALPVNRKIGLLN